MSEIDGGPAFPTSPNTQPGFYEHHGLSKRDYFAAAALGQATREIWSEHKPEDVAKRAYLIADAMLSAGASND